MSETYTVTAVSDNVNVNTFQGNDGPVVLHERQLKVTTPNGQEQVVIRAQKPDSTPPSVGDQITGTLTPIGGGPFKGQMKLKPDPKPGGGYGGGRNDAKIQRQVAVKCAAEVVAHQGLGKDKIIEWADAFENAINAGATPQVPSQDAAGPIDNFGQSAANDPDMDKVPF